MSIFEKIEGKAPHLESAIQRGLGSQDDPTEPAGFSVGGYSVGSRPPKKKTSEYLSSATGWVYACTTAIADAVSSVEIKLFQKNGETIEEVVDHPALAILDRVNPYTTKLDHFWLTQQYLELTGEAPWLIDRGASGKGDPVNIFLLRPDALDIIPDNDPNSPGLVKEYVYRMDGGKSTTIPANQLILVKYPDTVNSFRGKGTLQAAARVVDIDDYSEEWNQRFFYNSARPDSVIKTEQKLNDRQRKTLRTQIDQLYRGKQNAHTVAVLESGLDWKPMQISQKDMEFLEQQRFSRDKILSIFRVPKPIVAISEDVNLANATIGEYVFAKWTVVPKMKKLTAQLNEFLLPMFAGTEGMFYSFVDPVPENNTQKLARYESGLTKGWLTINEVRSEEGLPSVGSDGDRVLIPGGNRPLDQIDIPAGPTLFSINKRERQGFIDRSAGGYRLATRRLEVKKHLEKGQKRIDQYLNAVSRKIVTAALRKNAPVTKPDQHKRLDKEEIAQKALALYDRNERSFASVVHALFMQQANTVVAKLSDRRSVHGAETKALDVDELFDRNEQNQLFVRVLMPQMGRNVREGGSGGAVAIGLPGSSFDDQTKPVQNFISRRTIRLASEVNKETQQLLKSELVSGIAAGESVPDLTRRVRGLFDNMARYRAERIARSEVIRASNFGAQQAWRQSGIVKRKEWHVTNDDRTCQFCPQLDGKKVPEAEAFYDKGGNVAGSEGGLLNLDYETIERPPLHPNCRCVLLPVIESLEAKPEDFGSKVYTDTGIPESEREQYRQRIDDAFAGIDSHSPGLLKDYGEGLRISVTNATKGSPLKGMQVAGDYKNGRIPLMAPAGKTGDELAYLKKKLSDSIYHEIGHHFQENLEKVDPASYKKLVEFMASPAVTGTDLTNGPINTTISYYASKNPKEYFAEGFRQYMQNPAKLKGQDLKMYALLEDILSKYRR